MRRDGIRSISGNSRYNYKRLYVFKMYATINCPIQEVVAFRSKCICTEAGSCCCWNKKAKIQEEIYLEQSLLLSRSFFGGRRRAHRKPSFYVFRAINGDLTAFILPTKSLSEEGISSIFKGLPEITHMQHVEES